MAPAQGALDLDPCQANISEDPIILFQQFAEVLAAAEFPRQWTHDASQEEQHGGVPCQISLCLGTVFQSPDPRENVRWVSGSPML
jgi:hypothetical protein